MTIGQEDLETKPDALHLTPRPLRPAPRIATAC